MNAARQVRRRPRHLIAFTGVAILLWSGYEDSDALAVTALGVLAAVCVTLVLQASSRQQAAPVYGYALLIALLSGALTGALSALATALLMLFKDLRHGHIFPDYPPEMMLAMLERLPVWALAGASAGLGLGILRELGAEFRRRRG